MDASPLRLDLENTLAIPVAPESSVDHIKSTSQMTTSTERKGLTNSCTQMRIESSTHIFRYMTICNYASDGNGNDDSRAECPEIADDDGFDGYYPWLDDICGGVEPCLDCVPTP